ncbi:MAG: methyl-accepting chemotaxis protein [Planctomycetota bacterium]
MLKKNLSLTIGKKLALGFATMIALILIVSAVAYRGGSSNAIGVKDMKDIGHDVIVGNHAQQAMLMVRMNAKNFLIDNKPESLTAYNQWANTLEKTIADADANFEDPTRRKLLAQIQDKAKIYRAAFDEVSQEIQKRNHLYNNVLGPTGIQVRKDLAELNRTAFEAGHAQLVSDIGKLTTRFMLVRYYASQFRFTSNPKSYERVQAEFDAIAQASQLIGQAIGAYNNPEEAEAFEHVQANLDKYARTFEQVKIHVNNRNRLVFGTLDVVGPQIGELWFDIIETLDKDEHQIADTVQASVSHTNRVVITAAAIATAVGAVLAFFIAYSVVRPIRAITARLKDIAQGEGDLTQRVDEQRKDELGELGKWFNTFVKRIQDTIVEVSSASHEVAAAATEISSTSEQMVSGLDRQTQQAQLVAAAVEEFSHSVIEVAQKSAEAADQAKDSGDIATNGGSVVNDTITGMQNISAAVSASATSVQELGKRGEQIGEIIAVINDIADQTNLLALNAAIEAARAGEHGRGFAVVADEVRKLADRTTKATQEIGDSITAIQTETTLAVDRMNAGSEEVTQGVGKAQEAGDALTRIVTSAGSVADMIKSIAAAADEQSAAVSDVARNVENISSVTFESNEGAQQAATAALQLSQTSEELRTLVDQFKV